MTANTFTPQPGPGRQPGQPAQPGGPQPQFPPQPGAPGFGPGGPQPQPQFQNAQAPAAPSVHTGHGPGQAPGPYGPGPQGGFPGGPQPGPFAGVPQGQVANQPPGRISPLAGVPAKANFAGALRSEWTKIRTVRSTFWTLIVTMAVTIGLSALIAGAASNHDSTEGLLGEDLTQLSMTGLYLGQLVIVVFGALAVTAEYSTGMIRTSLTSQPRRGTLLAAKAVVTALVSLVVGLVSTFTSFFIASSFFAGKDVHIALSDPGVTRAVFGGALYLTGSALLAFGLGAILRHTAGAITTAVGLLFVATIVVNFLPGSWRDDVAKYLPANAGGGIINTLPHSDSLSPWGGFAVFTVYVAVALVAGALLVKKRDA